jgi:hypothetical protein
VSETSTSTAVPTSAWPNLLPSSVLKEWAEIVPGAPAVIIQEVINDARHLRRIAWFRLVSAVILFAGSLGVSILCVTTGAAPWGAAASAGAGTVTVVTMLLTGKPPALRGK